MNYCCKRLIFLCRLKCSNIKIRNRFCELLKITNIFHKTIVNKKKYLYIKKSLKLNLIWHKTRIEAYNSFFWRLRHILSSYVLQLYFLGRLWLQFRCIQKCQTWYHGSDVANCQVEYSIFSKAACGRSKIHAKAPSFTS